MNENLPIDLAKLDDEWAHQTLYFDEAQEFVSECLKTKNDLTEALEDVRAEERSMIRVNFKKLGYEKMPSIEAVNDIVRKLGKVQRAVDDLNNAIYEYEKAKNTVKSFEMRKKALEKETDLWISNYYSIPNPNRLVEEGKRFIKTSNVEEQSEKVMKALNEKKLEQKDKEEPKRRKRR